MLVCYAKSQCLEKGYRGLGVFGQVLSRFEIASCAGLRGSDQV